MNSLPQKGPVVTSPALPQPNWSGAHRSHPQCSNPFTSLAAQSQGVSLHTYMPVQAAHPAGLPSLQGRQRVALPTTIPAHFCLANKGPAELSYQTEISHCWQMGRGVALPTMTPAEVPLHNHKGTLLAEINHCCQMGVNMAPPTAHQQELRLHHK